VRALAPSLRPLVLVLALGTLASCSTLRQALIDSWNDEAPAPAAPSAPAPTAAPQGATTGLGFLDGLGASDDDSGLGFAIRTLQAVHRANEDLTPEQEYALGRAFGAQVLTTRRPLDNEAANRYLNQVGQALALFSERPDTWSGYRFLLLDTPEVNAFAAPGGLIFVTRGLVKLTRNEDELAAVLAHEIGHVEREHGLKAIRKDRLATAVVGIGADAAQTFGGSRIQELSAAFEDSIADLTKTIVNNGYSRDTEFEADTAALGILARAGYPPQALVTMLEALKGLPQGAPGFGKTHPSPDQRIAQVKDQVKGRRTYTLTSTQKRRYQAALGGL